MKKKLLFTLLIAIVFFIGVFAFDILTHDICPDGYRQQGDHCIAINFSSTK